MADNTPAKEARSERDVVVDERVSLLTSGKSLSEKFGGVVTVADYKVDSLRKPVIKAVVNAYMDSKRPVSGKEDPVTKIMAEIESEARQLPEGAVADSEAAIASDALKRVSAKENRPGFYKVLEGTSKYIAALTEDAKKNNITSIPGGLMNLYPDEFAGVKAFVDTLARNENGTNQPGVL